MGFRKIVFPALGGSDASLSPTVSLTSTGVLVNNGAWLWHSEKCALRDVRVVRGVPRFLRLTFRVGWRWHVVRLPFAAEMYSDMAGIEEMLRDKLAGTSR